MNISEYKELFLAESKELIATLNRLLLELEKNPGSISLVEEIFRNIHTLKGMSGTMGYQKIVMVTHHVEELLGKLKQDNKMPNEEIIDLFFSSVDLLTRLIDLSGTPDVEEVDINPFLNKAKLISDSIADMQLFEAVQEEERKVISEEFKEARREWKKYQKDMKKGYELVKVVVKLVSSCQLMGTRAYVILNRIQELGRIIKTFPDIDSLKKGKFDLDFLVFMSTKDREGVKTKIQTVPEVEWVKIDTTEFREIYSVYFSVDTKDAQLVEAEEKQDIEVSKYLPTEAESIRVNMKHLNDLMNLTGELFILQGRMENLGQSYKLKELNNLLDYSSHLVSSLQDSIMSARMVPVWQVFNLFPRFIRDTAKRMGKKINYLIEGGDIEIDRMVLDKISEPLIHLIRNCIDHGLETPEERVNAGKSEEGLIKVSISRQGYTFIILVEDDGRGIDIEQVKLLSLEKGFVSEPELEAMSQEEILHLITKSGYSTSLEATDVSGRGVGLSIVYRSITSLGGSSKIKTEKGQGTHFSIMLPATMAIVKVLLIGIDSETYAIPISYVSEVIEQPDAKVKGVGKNQVLVYRGENYPLLRLKYIFSPTEQETACSLEEYILLVEVDEKNLALVVDSFYKQHDVVVKPFDQIKTDLNCFSGATILGNGQVALIIDPRGLIM